jgi:3-dehydroquinate synthase
MHAIKISNQLSELVAACPEVFLPEGDVFILSDENTHKMCWPVISGLFSQQVRHIVTGAGEVNKNLSSCQVIWKHLFSDGGDRHAILLNLGGGTVTDLGGFAAATYMRGIRFVNMPTSLLGMVDAGLGGKTGIDMDHFKNIIGTFTFPSQVLVYPGFLQTLPDVEWKNGIAEMLKHGLIRDAALWNSLSGLLDGNDKVLSNASKQAIIGLIPDAIKVKSDVVRSDPGEKSERKLLNFGHTVGHALESWSLKHDHEPVSHGHAITAGMICEVYLSEKLELLQPGISKSIVPVLRKLFPSYPVPKSAQQEIVKIMRQDKKSKSGKINMALLDAIGNAVIREGISEELVVESLHFYNSGV